MLNRPPSTSDLVYTDLRLPGAVVVDGEERQDKHKKRFSALCTTAFHWKLILGDSKYQLAWYSSGADSERLG